MVGQLIGHAGILGLDLTFGDAFATSGHSKNSFHYKRLAIDFNLIIDGELQHDSEAHRPLGEYWVSIGGTWGGNFKKPDGNHYSYTE